MPTSPRVLDGKWLASQVHLGIAREVEAGRARAGRAPGLAVILVGDNPASKAYVATKSKVAKACGFETFDIVLPASASAAELARGIEQFNSDARVDGILLQLPLPSHLSQNEHLDRILPEKDADGLHPLNQGLLTRGEGVLRPCTPSGVMMLIDLAYASGIIVGQPLTAALPRGDLAGKHAVVIGRSILVGKPVGLMLLERNATVTMAHSKTADLPAVVRSADIVVAAVGVPNLVKGDWIKPGAVVIDVGINRLPNGTLTGDVEYAGAAERASAITPVPGGAGPMTVAMLVRNTLRSWQRRCGVAAPTGTN